MHNKEIRYTIDSQFETRAEGKGFRIGGYASVFDKRSQNLGGFVEIVQGGAFSKTINESDVRALWNHNADHVLGRNKAGTLRMSEDSTGLFYEVDLPDTQTGRDIYESIQRGDVTQSSFGFSTIEDGWGLTEDDFPVRTLKEVVLYDVSPVTYPAYLDASIGVRAIERLAEMRNIDLADAQNDLVSAVRGNNTAPVKTTYAVGSYFDPSEILVIRGRMKGLKA
ncbi:HK97 family phage prohead protease [Saccharothrix ecbatanensis]|uniref:HK97 family phage prohead protease n=1 Tax=Saccharothrix ecbatanensis TaxID=1105145 RepID=A0A7W9HM56_9PSEU|nr:HK97 family phage prohead protease [Saccharothrix ecbatanensis]MBB5804661.1 HK97 family phage prohead protease [Saccharothrix ecbatanensis]